LDRQPSASVWITTITLFEARFGLALLPSSRRRQALEAAFVRLLQEDLENRVLDFDSAAATEAALRAAERQNSGRPVGRRDTGSTRNGNDWLTQPIIHHCAAKIRTKAQFLSLPRDCVV
jgi:predicted nucleic acid-binding protein